ncbi:hypothetical protein PoB_002538400 [Plakobranchus ocellatus]|uniref:Uncharacterized protein n=1 Tax=Plakobranchus ocellatus TaxID=259542 RepID=A0AAV3ZU61_9GAST|nr:hypothetical protein PoB_002538400 [Plakobranchus ocellatus]
MPKMAKVTKLWLCDSDYAVSRMVPTNCEAGHVNSCLQYPFSLIPASQDHMLAAAGATLVDLFLHLAQKLFKVSL